MSTVMYCYWIKKGDEFEVANKVRKFLEQEWSIFRAKGGNNAIKLAYQYKDRYSPNIQLFSVSSDYYLARFLIDSYIVENNSEELGLEPCFYDDRSDMTKEEMGNEIYAAIIDALLLKHEYYIIPLINPAYIMNFYHEQQIKDLNLTYDNNSKILEK